MNIKCLMNDLQYLIFFIIKLREISYVLLKYKLKLNFITWYIISLSVDIIFYIINHNLTEGNTSGKTSFTKEKIKKSLYYVFMDCGTKYIPVNLKNEVKRES